MDTKRKIEKYIEETLPVCTRERKEDDLEVKLYGLPYPYSVPSAGHFDELYYWDTYFLNMMFRFNGQWHQMKNNADDMLYMVERFGYMGNSNRMWHLKTSQPPFLSEIVKEVYQHYNDKDWLGKAYKTLQKEYKFWMTKRKTEIGLNQYGCMLEEKDVESSSTHLPYRVGYAPEGVSKYELARQYLIACESGWDMCYRWGFEAHMYAQVDLNSILYGFEKNMEYFAEELGFEESAKWSRRAEKRRKLMNKYMLANNSVFYDYSMRTKELGIFTSASVFPLYFGLATEKQAQAFAENVTRIEEEYGVTICEKHEIKGNYQWAYPNAWPCMQHLVVFGLERYGYTDIALRIGKKYVGMVEKIFEETGELWEKYNAVNGTHKSLGNDASIMLGWTAGTYLTIKNFIEEKEKN